MRIAKAPGGELRIARPRYDGPATPWNLDIPAATHDTIYSAETAAAEVTRWIRGL